MTCEETLTDGMKRRMMDDYLGLRLKLSIQYPAQDSIRPLGLSLK